MAIDGGSVEIRFEGDTSSFKRSIEEAESYIDEFGNKWNLVEKGINGSSTFTRWEKDTTTSFQNFSDAARRAFADAFDAADDFSSQLKEIGTSLKSIGLGALTAGATAATRSLIKMAKAGVADTQALENTQIQMIGLTDSVEKGNKAMGMAIKYFKNNPFNRFEVTNATKSLIQFGAELDSIPDLLDKLGKVSLSTGASLDTMAYYYQRNISDGRVATRDLLQMQNQGIPIFGALAKQIGVTSGAIRELAAKGKISVEDFQKAFDSLVSDEAMERFNNTLSRQVDRFKGRMSDMRGAIAGYTMDEATGQFLINENGIYRSYTKLLKKLADLMTSSGDNANPVGVKLVEGFTKLSDAIGKLIDKVTNLAEPALNAFGNILNFLGDNSELVIPLIGGLAVALGKFGSHLPVVGELIKGVTNNFGKLSLGIRNLVSTHPLLSALVMLFTVGFAEAMKTDEEFKKTIQDLGAALKEIISVVISAGKGVFDALLSVIKELASSGAIKAILQGVATALKVIAQAIASIPPEAIAGLLSFILSLKLLNASPVMFAVTAITLLIQYIKELGGISKIFENLPEKLNTIGHNIMTGLFNGIKEGAGKVINFVKQVASSILTTFKNMFGIHSPSTVMYDMGINMGLGLANGITDSEDAVQVAMTNLAEDILKLSEKIIANKVDFGILDINAEYKEWKKVSKLFTEGSEQYNYAIEKMEDARKKANLKILELQQSYNDALDNTINKIASMYGLFDEVNLGGSKNSNQILKNLDKQVAKMQEWAEAQKSIANLGLDDELVKELQAMGVDATGELSAIAQMTSDELSTLNDMWLKKQSIANEEGVRQMTDLKEDTLDQINQLKNGIDGATVDIEDVGGRLVENIAEGVYGAMPTLESALDQLGDYIEKAKRELAKSGGEGADATGGLGNTNDTDDLIGGIKEGITANLDKVKSMLPNILLGAIGAWGAVKFGPKIVKAIFNKVGKALLNTNSLGAQNVAGSLFKSADLGVGLRDGLVDAIDHIPREDTTVTGKVINKIQDWLTPKNGSKVAEAAQNVAKTSQPAQKIAQSSQQISQSVQTTGQSFSQASGWMNSIQQGAKTIIYIAGAIAAVAAALWVTYKALKDVDFGKLAIQLGMMGLAVTEFGVLAMLADKLKVSAKGILTIAGIAADIALVALACGLAYKAMKDIDWDIYAKVLGRMAESLIVMGVLATAAGAVMELTAGAMALGILAIAGIAADIAVSAIAIKYAYDQMKDIDFERFQYVILEMIEALGVMGGFSALFGLLAPLVGLGWLSIVAICDELCRVSEALYKVYNTVPDDFDGVNDKIDLIKKVLNKIVDTDLGTLIGTIVTSWEVGPLTRIIDMYVYVAEQLNKLSQIELKADDIEGNLNYIKATLNTIKAKTDMISGWLEASALDMEASTVENAGRIVIVYGNMVDALNKLANFKPDEAAISKSLVSMVAVITMLRNQSYGGGGLFSIFNDMGTVANDVDKIKSIVNNYLEMIPTIKSLGESENKISDTLETTVVKNVDNIKDIVLAIGSVDTGGWIDQKESDMGKIQSILNKFTELEPVMWQISQFNMSYTEDAKTKIGKVRDLVLEIGKVDTGGWIDQKESDMNKIQSILNKFTEVAKTTQLLGEYPVADNATTWVQTVRNLVWEIGQINNSQSGSLDSKIEVIEKSKTIAQKLGEFASVIQNLQSVDKGSVIESLTSSLNQLLNGVSDSLNNRTSDLENIGAKLGQSLASGVQSQGDTMTSAGNALQSAFWWAINNRMQDEYYQGRSLGERFRQGLYDVDYGNAGWWAVQGFINGAWGRAGSGDGVYNAGWWIADRFLKGLKDRGGQGSPWKTTMESGVFAVEGLVEGLKASEGALVDEANSLADQVIDALTIDDLAMSPTLDVGTSGGLAPSMDIEGSYARTNGNVIIRQTNNNYTEYDVEQVQRDLAWELSKV